MSQQQSKTEIVIAAVDKATSTLSAIGAKMDAMTRPAADLSKAFGKLYDSTGLGGVKKAVGGLKDSMLGLGGAVIGIGGVYAGSVGAIIAWGNHAAEAAHKIKDLSARYQLDSQMLQVYGTMIEETGGNIEDAAAALGKLKKNMNEAMHGGKEQAAAFAGVGISLEQLKKMSPEQVLQKMADAFKGSEKDMAKQAVLLELMGKNGTVFMEVLNKGADAARQRYGEMREDGAMLSQEQLKQAEEYESVWKRLQRTLNGIGITLGLKFATAIQPLISTMQQLMVANREIIDQKFDEFLKRIPDIIEVGTMMFKGLWGVVKLVGGAFKSLNGVMGPTGTTLLMLSGVMSPVILSALSLFMSLGKVAWIIANVTGIIPALTAGFSALWVVMMANPIIAIGAAIVAAAVAIYVYWDPIVEFMTKAWAKISEAASACWDLVAGVVSIAWDKIKSIFDPNFFSSLIQGWLQSWQELGNGIKNVIKSAIPDSLIPDSVKNFKMSVATDYLTKITGGTPSASSSVQGTTTAAAAAQTQKQDIKNTIKIQIDSEGRPTVKELAAGSTNTRIDVSAGLAMAGGL